MRVLHVALSAVVLASPAMARDDGQWSGQSAEIRLWFQSVMQPEHPHISCCGEGDAFEVTLDGDNPDGSIAVVIVNGRGMIPDGTPLDVPRSKLQPKFGNPLDHYILFIAGDGRLLCLIPKSGV
jgi:hypothetical protein